MNEFLANAIGTLNSLIAWALIIVPTVAGGYMSVEATVIGLVSGVILAILVCGTIALLIDMRNCLRKLAEPAEGKPESVEGNPWNHA